MPSIFPHTHLLTAAQCDRATVDAVIARATEIARTPERFTRALAGRIIATLFYEPSTRTRLSFEAAALRLGAHIIGTENAAAFSSAIKGETLEDSIRVIGGYADAIVLRHGDDAAGERAARASVVPIISAGSGSAHHVTQALLDAFTIHAHHGTLDNLTVALCGDALHGRTIASLAELLAHEDNTRIIFVTPPTLRAPRALISALRRSGVVCHETTCFDDDVISQADVVYMTRTQRERGSRGTALILTPAHVRRMRRDAIIMHPLPRTDELPAAIDHDPRAHYFTQASNGLVVRMAILTLLVG